MDGEERTVYVWLVHLVLELKTECVFCHFDRYGKKRVLQDFYILILVRKHYACGK